MPRLLAASEADPMDVIDAYQSATILAGLRDTLGEASAANPRLAVAEMALVDLALAADPRDAAGRGGIWRRRAREVRDLRRAAGVVPKSFSAAIPDLWVDALDGNTATCMSALAHFPEAKDTPHARALRCWVTADWRELAQRTDLGVHERLALAVAYGRCQMGQALARMPEAGLPPMAFAALRNMTDSYAEEWYYAAQRQALRLVPAIAASAHLPAEAEPRVDTLAQTLEIFTTPARAERLPIFLRAMDNGDAVLHGQAVFAGLSLAEAAASVPGGLRDRTQWRLIGLGDWAPATRLALLLGIWHRHDYAGLSFGEHLSWGVIYTEVRDQDQGLCGAIEGLNPDSGDQVVAGRRVLAAISAELARKEYGIPPCRLIAAAQDVRLNVKQLDGEARQTLERVLDAQHVDEAGRAAGWTEVGRIASHVGLLGRIAEDIQAAAAADPWSPELERLALASRSAPNHPASLEAEDDALLGAQIQRLPWRLDLKAQRFAVLYGSRRFADAERVAAEIVALDSGNSQVGRRYGQCLSNLGRSSEAIAAWRAYLAVSNAYDVPNVQADLGAALERAGDPNGAEKAYATGALSRSFDSIVAYAFILRRHGRSALALAQVEKLLGRFGKSTGLDLLAAACLLAGESDPEHITAAFARANAAKRWMPRTEFYMDFLVEVRRLRLHDRFLPMIDPEWKTASNGLSSRIGLVLLECGHPAEATSWFAAASEPGRVSEAALGYCLVLQTLAARLAKRPDLAVPAAAIRGRIGHGDFMMTASDPLLRYVAGDCDRATALAQEGANGDELRFYFGIDAAAAGDLATARADLKMTAAHPNWDEAGGATRLLEWLAAGAPILDAKKAVGASDF